MNKPKEILKLEKIYGITLNEIALSEDIIYSKNLNCYQLNSKNEITGLNLYGNQINEIKGLERLTQLQSLDFSYNDLAEIKGLEQLTQLQYLDLSSNQLTEIKGLEQLTQLQTLNLSVNELTEIKGLEQLTQLQTLNLSVNELTEIKGLEQLTQLHILWLSGNQLTEIKGLEQLTQLQNLDLSGNQLTEIKGLEQLTQLQELYLYGNQLAEIKGLEKTLRQKDFMKLQIDINPFLQQSSLILEFGWKQNHKDDILKYFSDIDEKQEKKKITLPAKIMFLGNHAAGKTTFLRYLLYDTLSNKKIKSTHVLEVYSYPVKLQKNKLLPQAVIYDFGGQDYYHGIYRAFFSENSISLLFWCNESNKNDVRKAQDKTDCDTYDFTWSYWLFQLDEAMNRRSKEEDTKEPLLLVQTHADLPNNKECIYSDILNNLINFEIKGKYYIALLEEATEDETTNTQRLKEDLVRIMNRKGKTSQLEKPIYYEKFLHYVLNFKGAGYVRVKEDILDAGRYERIPINNETSYDMLTYLKSDLYQLHLQGIVLYYRNSSIDDIVWLNSSKTIEYIYNDILSKDIITDKKGIINEVDFDDLWKKSKTKEPDKSKEVGFEKIKELLIKEKIIFHDISRKEYIIPSFLPLSHEDKQQKTLSRSFEGQAPSFILKFRNFIPFGLINELICLYGNLPDDKNYCRDQLNFWFDEKHNVWIKLDLSQLSIKVYIRENNVKSELKLNEVKKAVFLNIIDLYRGDNSAQWFYNDKIPNFSERVKQYIKKKEMEEIKYPNEMYISVVEGIYVNPIDFDKNPTTIPAYELKDSGETTREGKIVKILNEKSTITHAIEFYDDFNNKRITVTKMKKKIFISYSRNDVKYKDGLTKQLNLLEMFGIADNWCCEDITIEKWHDKIQKELLESDLIIYMLSDNFFNSTYILENEVKEGLKQVSANKDKKIVCVIVSDFIKLEKLKDFLKGKLITNTQEAIIKLSEWQYLPYGIEKDELTGDSEEKIIPLERYPHKKRAYAQITEKVLQALTRSNLT